MRQQFARRDIGDLVTALGFVHVMGRHQHGEAFGGERMDFVPELAPRLGIDAGGRLVEQEQLRIGQRAGAERKPLLPAAGEGARELFLAAGEPEPFDHRARGGARIGHAVDAADEFEIFPHRQVVVQAEALGHVADVALDLVRFGADVETETAPGAGIRGEQPAQHPDGRGLARAVGAEKAVDLAAFDLHRQVVHHRVGAERLGQPLHLDGDVGRAGHCVALLVMALSFVKATSTGWPTRTLAGSVGSASMRKTNLERSSRL